MPRPVTPYHRVFAHYHGPLWVGVAWLERHGGVTRDNEFTVLPVARQGFVCLTLDDGRVLCDYGPEHVHDDLRAVLDHD